MSKRFSILLVVLSTLVYFVGCVGYGGLPSIDDPKYVSQSVDADKKGGINEEDVKQLEIKADECFDSLVLPFYKKAGIELKREQDIPLIYILKSIDTEQNIKILEGNLTVAEWKKLRDGRDKLNKVVRQLEATREYVNKGGITESGIVGGNALVPDRLGFWFEDGRLAELIGIRIPTTISKYRKMSIDLFYKLALNEKAGIEYDVVKNDWTNQFLYVYIYVSDKFINAEMVSRGYARAKPTLQNSKYDSLFMKLEKYAKENKLGIWAFTDDW
jgi:hypothetical protein